MLREINSHQRLVRKMFFNVDGSVVAGGTLTKNGLLAGAQQGLITENSSGNYTITFNEPGSRILGVQATTFTDVSTMRVIAASATSVQVEQVGADQTTPLADGDFFLEVTLSDAADDT